MDFILLDQIDKQKFGQNATYFSREKPPFLLKSVTLYSEDSVQRPQKHVCKFFHFHKIKQLNLTIGTEKICDFLHFDRIANRHFAKWTTVSQVASAETLTVVTFPIQ